MEKVEIKETLRFNQHLSEIKNKNEEKYEYLYIVVV